MQNDVKTKLAFLLREKRCCKFEVHFMFKGGTSLELEYDGKKNQECGELYDTLDDWLVDFSHNFLIEHCFRFTYFEGSICLENNNGTENLKIGVAIHVTCEDWAEDFTIDFDEDFYTKELALNLNEIGINQFDKKCMNLFFSIEKGNFKDELVLHYYLVDQEKVINLNNKQQFILKAHLLDFVINNAPIIDIDFDCDQIINAECYCSTISYNISTSYIYLNWNEIYPE
jgi:hypothetical protein